MGFGGWGSVWKAGEWEVGGGVRGVRCTTLNAYASVGVISITAVRLRKDLKLPMKQARTKPNRQVQAHNSKRNKNVSERTLKR